MTFHLLLGICCLIYGIATLVIRQVRPESLAKLATFRRLYGEKQGTLLHLFFYTILPGGIGIYLIVRHGTGMK